MTPVGTFFFRSNAELNSSFTCPMIVQKENRWTWTTDTGLEGVAGHLFKLLQVSAEMLASRNNDAGECVCLL